MINIWNTDHTMPLPKNVRNILHLFHNMIQQYNIKTLFFSVQRGRKWQLLPPLLIKYIHLHILYTSVVDILVDEVTVELTLVLEGRVRVEGAGLRITKTKQKATWLFFFLFSSSCFFFLFFFFYS